MASLTVREVFRQARESVADPNGIAYGDLDAMIADGIVCLFEWMGESEVEKRLGAKLRERGPERKGYRNGYRSRRVQSSYQTLTIRIPRIREGGFIPAYLEPNKRAVRQTENWVTKALLCGISRAEVVRFMESTTGCRPSEGLLRSVQEDLDKRAAVFRERPLTEEYEYLFLDAAYAKDIIGNKARRICILTAIGVTADGKKEILGFERAHKECQSAWGRFLDRLEVRGLKIAPLRMVISDEDKGIRAAVQDTWGDIPHQFCWAHRCRNIHEAVRKCDRKEMAQSLRAIYKAAHSTGAKSAFRACRDKWQDSYPALMTELEKDLGNLLPFLDCPELHREYVRTTNPIERAFLELRRSRFGCGAFANRQSCERVVANVYMRLNDLWKGRSVWVERRRRLARQAAAMESRRKAAHDESRLAHRTDPVSGARVAPQHSPILPDGYSDRSQGQIPIPV